jgi:two-component SAPR family response regulator
MGWKAMDRSWRIELFGDFTVLKDGKPTAPEVAARTATTDLLALLTLNKGRWCDSDTLAARLWPASEPWQAQGSLHAATSRLRRALGDSGKDIIARKGQLYRIDSDKASSDVEDFDRLARKVTFADGINDGIKTALAEIEGLYKGDLLGRGDACRNRVLHAYNEEYREKMLGVWEVAAGLYSERGDVSSRAQARWYAESARRLGGAEATEPPRAENKGLGAQRPSIRQQLAEGRQQIAQQRAAMPQKAAARPQGMEV